MAADRSTACSQRNGGGDGGAVCTCGRLRTSSAVSMLCLLMPERPCSADKPVGPPAGMEGLERISPASPTFMLGSKSSPLVCGTATSSQLHWKVLSPKGLSGTCCRKTTLSVAVCTSAGSMMPDRSRAARMQSVGVPAHSAMRTSATLKLFRRFRRRSQYANLCLDSQGLWACTP